MLVGLREVIRIARKSIKLYKKCKQTDETKVRKLLFVNLFRIVPMLRRLHLVYRANLGRHLKIVHAEYKK